MAGWYRGLKKGDTLAINGPAVIIVESGRPNVRVRAADTTTINLERKRRRKPLTRKPRRK